MSFQEVHVSQFTSATTPFTACRHKDGFFATTTHSLHCTVENDTVKVSAGPLPSSREHCVGHDQSGAWHLYSFLDSDDEQVLRNVSSQSTEQAAPSSSTNRRVSHSSLESSMRSVEASLSSLADAEVSTEQAHDNNDDDTTIAWLVLRSKEEIAPTFTAPLSFRPLSPVLTSPMNHYSEDETRVVAWVGSADDSELRCFIPTQDDNVALFKQVTLEDKDAFSFDSPVMVMDSLEGKNQQHWIAVGCQDGTVRIISFRFTRTGDSLHFSKLEAHTVLVDGPIIALHLSQEKGNGTIHLLVGSMCGFACGLKKEQNQEFKGPWMVVEGLWNSSLDSEDAILAVNKLPNNMVAVGTHAGVCHVYRQRDDKSYQLLWKVQLPYSIHGLSHINVSSSGQPYLLVTTRYTFHVFQRNVPKYSADTAKRRIEKLISQRQDATELLNLA